MNLYIQEIKKDIQYLHDIVFEKAKSEFKFEGKKGPIIALHGIGGGWTKTGFREYMAKNEVSGVLTYFGEMTDGLDNYIDTLNTYIERYSNPIVVGFSAGGIVALKYAEKYGWNTLKKIITVATPLFGSPIANNFGFIGQSLKELVINSDYLMKVRSINPPKNKVLSIFAKRDLKAPYSNDYRLNWNSLVLNNAKSHGEIHSNYKLIEPFLNTALEM